jgi:FkbM family methyltransferase
MKRWALATPRRRKLVRWLAQWTQEHTRSIRFGPGRGLKYRGGDIPFEVLGLSEREVQRALTCHLKRGVTFWDVGAHAGFYAVLAARLAGPQGRTECFEPLPENLSLLERNLAENNCPASVHRIALADEDGEGFLSVPRSRTAQLADEGIPVKLARGDSLELPPPSVVKIDVEGAELRVLRGMTRTLSVHKPVVIVECHGALGSQVRAALEEQDYEVERLAGSRVHLVAQRRPRVALDI